jgi:hypothetical protein
MPPYACVYTYTHADACCFSLAHYTTIHIHIHMQSFAHTHTHTYTHALPHYTHAPATKDHVRDAGFFADELDVPTLLEKPFAADFQGAYELYR